jgi:hypothetical protein
VIDMTTDNNTSPSQGAPQGGPSTITERPQWLPEKFSSGEDLAKAYSELQKKLSGGQQQTQDQQQQQDQQTHDQDQQQENQVPQSANQAAELVESVGLDYEALSRSFSQNGELSPAQYAVLDAHGISPDAVHQFIAGQMAVANQIRDEVLAPVGGAERYAEMLDWAASHGTADEIDAFNRAMDGNVEQVKLAVGALKARYVAANGERPQLLLGGSSSAFNSRASDVYSSTAEVTAAMKDPRYANDPAYREDVIARLGRSSVF